MQLGKYGQGKREGKSLTVGGTERKIGLGSPRKKSAREIGAERLLKGGGITLSNGDSGKRSIQNI